jgi:GTP-binding protein LepA
LIATAPSVVYHVLTTAGERLSIDNPAKLPPMPNVALMEEPYVKASIITPAEYIGAIMDLCQSRRGTMVSMDYISPQRVIFVYDLPLAEVIIDFFDQLKSRTKGYASMDYEVTDYRAGELVKLDILLNGESVDALSFIVHTANATSWGRQLAERLKEVIPRQMFDVPIQAAIGNKILARETVKAMRKNVLAKCYGGDISRKRKLLEKQKEGKKRMKQVGNVELPQEAFMAVLKLERGL